MTDNNIVSVLDCDVFFEKLKDRPDFIKFYLEFKTISIYLNKINTILELVNVLLCINTLQEPKSPMNI